MYSHLIRKEFSRTNALCRKREIFLTRKDVRQVIYIIDIIAIINKTVSSDILQNSMQLVSIISNFFIAVGSRICSI